MRVVFCVSAALAFCGGTAGAANIDLNTWTQQGPLTNGNWTVSPDGSNVVQSVNGNPTFFVSPESFIDRTFQGSFEVQSGGDNDFIGFVFGYQSPITADGDADTDYDFLLFSWKQANQSPALEGFTLSHVNGSPAPSVFWNHQTDDPGEGYNVIDTDLGPTRGWQTAREYEFTLTYETDRIQIAIQDIDTGAPPAFAAQETIFDVNFTDLDAALQTELGGSFQSGRFGFYNYSQADVRYEGFTEDSNPVADPGGPYLFSATNDTVTLDASGSYDPDDGTAPGDGIISYQWTPEMGPSINSATGPVSLIESGITNVGDTAVAQLLIEDNEGNLVTSSATLSYANASPIIVSLVATRNPLDGSVTFSGVIDDADLGMAGLIDFDTLVMEIDGTSDSLIGDGFLFLDAGGSLTGSIPFSLTASYADLLAEFGSDGTWTAYLNLADSAGGGDTLPVQFLLSDQQDPLPPGPPSVPAPGALGLLLAGLAGMGWRSHVSHQPEAKEAKGG